MITLKTPLYVTEDDTVGIVELYDADHNHLIGLNWTETHRRTLSQIADLADSHTELLAALEQIIEEFNPKRPDWHLMVSSEGQRLARAAIAKARGINTSNCVKCGAALSDDAHPELCPACTPPEPRKGEYLIPAGARAGSCRSCGADVLWITTAKGSAMPLSSATIEERDGERYALSHFSDCPQGKGWSKKSR